MRRILAGNRIWNRVAYSNRVKFESNVAFSSAPENGKTTAANNVDGGGGSSNESSSSSSSLSSYKEQYKALGNLDFMTAAKILFTEPSKKKKFGLDFHLVQLFFVCLPSLAVYLVAQYARSEMRKMDAELERKKQAEFEAQAKEMELKAAEEKATVASNPALLEMKERLDKLELTVNEIAVESKRHLTHDTKEGREYINKQKQSAEVEPDNTQNQSGGRTSTEGIVSSEEKTSGLAPVSQNSQNTKKGDKK